MIEIGQISRVTFYECFLHRLDNSRLNQVQIYIFYLILSLCGIKFFIKTNKSAHCKGITIGKAFL